MKEVDYYHMIIEKNVPVQDIKKILEENYTDVFVNERKDNPIITFSFIDNFETRILSYEKIINTRTKKENCLLEITAWGNAKEILEQIAGSYIKYNLYLVQNKKMILQK